jgi:hypothetical protein
MKGIQTSNVFDFIEYLDYIAETGFVYYVDGKETTILYPTFELEYKRDVYIHYNSMDKEGFIQIGDSIYRFKKENSKI